MSITVGRDVACAVLTGGAVTCWGDIGDVGLGNGTATISSIPVRISDLSSGIQAFSTGAMHSCVVAPLDLIKCVGANFWGQLGDGTTTDRSSVFVTVVGIAGLWPGAQSLSSGTDFTCAVTSAGAVKCWGFNLQGQLGNDSTSSSSTPVTVTGLSSGAVAVSAGDSHACALTSAGGVKCWGIGSYGQLGNGAPIAQSVVPVDVVGLSSGVKAISAGGRHTCAQTSAGGVKCWGLDEEGQLGDNGAGSQQAAPVDVLGLSSSAQAISAGFYHTCAITAGGGAKCWGINTDGELGNGSFSSAGAKNPLPSDVVGLSSGVQTISAGSDATCAILSGGAVKCWGVILGPSAGPAVHPTSPVPIDITGL